MVDKFLLSTNLKQCVIQRLEKLSLQEQVCTLHCPHYRTKWHKLFARRFASRKKCNYNLNICVKDVLRILDQYFVMANDGFTSYRRRKMQLFMNYWMMCVESSEVERHLQEKILQILTGRIYYINIYPHLYALNSWNFPTKTFHLPSQKCV